MGKLKKMTLTKSDEGSSFFLRMTDKSPHRLSISHGLRDKSTGALFLLAITEVPLLDQYVRHELPRHLCRG